MDKARRSANKRLATMERQMRRVYKQYPELTAAKKQYEEYMKLVKEKTEKEYNAYTRANYEEKNSLRNAYAEAVKDLTINSAEYKKIVNRFVAAMSKANQTAIDVANNEMIAIYTESYNQVAEECRRAGIRVNGKKRKS